VNTHTFWHLRWVEGRIGWHEASGNALLQKHWRSNGRRVLVPLCGKSADMVWLAQQGNAVVGVELSPIGVDAFFAENELDFEQRNDVYRATDLDITIHLGDYFSFDDEPFDALYDRAALVALSADFRAEYVRKTNALLAPDSEMLVVTFEYDQSRVEGPPYSVPDDEVLSYWPALEKLESRNEIDNSAPKFREAGFTEVTETVWRSRRD